MVSHIQRGNTFLQSYLKKRMEEIVFWCKMMVEVGHWLELIQLKADVSQIYHSRSNPLRDGFDWKSWWA
jgi:hypothetical protein